MCSNYVPCIKTARQRSNLNLHTSRFEESEGIVVAFSGRALPNFFTFWTWDQCLLEKKIFLTETTKSRVKKRWRAPLLCASIEFL